ncbi:MAG TPA: hypothetical protein VNO32_37860, partial [Candidatus Acidoferrum sp.]|nr:hypothetical protein [Candidatus Acidoferrum sp.]
DNRRTGEQADEFAPLHGVSPLAQKNRSARVQEPNTRRDAGTPSFTSQVRYRSKATDLRCSRESALPPAAVNFAGWAILYLTVAGCDI